MIRYNFAVSLTEKSVIYWNYLIISIKQLNHNPEIIIHEHLSEIPPCERPITLNTKKTTRSDPRCYSSEVFFLQR